MMKSSSLPVKFTCKGDDRIVQWLFFKFCCDVRGAIDPEVPRVSQQTLNSIITSITKTWQRVSQRSRAIVEDIADSAVGRHYSPPPSDDDGGGACGGGGCFDNCFTGSSIVTVLETPGRVVSRSVSQLEIGMTVVTGSRNSSEAHRRINRIWNIPVGRHIETVRMSPGCVVTSGHPVLVCDQWRRPYDVAKVRWTYEEAVYSFELEGHVDTILLGGIVCATLGRDCGIDWHWIFSRKTTSCDRHQCPICVKIVDDRIDFARVFVDSGGCFSGDSRLTITAPGVGRKMSRVDAIRAGDEVSVADGTATVLCVVRLARPLKKPLVQFPGGLAISPGHPVRVRGAWQLPRDMGYTEAKHSGFVYNFVLSRSHVLLVNGIECATWGHGIRGQVIEHYFYGSKAVVRFLMQQPGWGQGSVLLGN